MKDDRGGDPWVGGDVQVVWKGVERRMSRPEVVGRHAAAASFGGFQLMAVRRLGIDSFLRLRED
ncbi:MAG: hypothetical protein M3Z00_05835 [Actinomycetota bacterium]|nr:hypothetical protein [Actinomycetota bacterium]